MYAKQGQKSQTSHDLTLVFISGYGLRLRLKFCITTNNINNKITHTDIKFIRVMLNKDDNVKPDNNIG